MDCKERSLDLITDIIAYPDEAMTFSKELQVFSKYITSDQYTVNEEMAIKVPLSKKSAKLSESSKDELHGTEYTVSLSWEVEKLDADAYEVLHSLKNRYKHLIVKTFGDNAYLVRSVEDGYRFTFEENEGKMKCELSVMNVSGAQRVL